MSDHTDEKTASPTVSPTDSSRTTPPAHHHDEHRHRLDLRKIIHPLSGRHYRIVSSPHEVEPARLTLQSTLGHDDFSVLVHGSDEHISVLRDLHRHHADHRQQLTRDNAAVIERYDRVRADLRVLGEELHALADRAVCAASFDRFGVSARIRTIRDGGSESAGRSGEGEGGDGDEEEVKTIKLFRRPVVRQYFHHGLLWRSARASEVLSFELFVDLVYVAVVDVLGEAATTDASRTTFLHYCIVFALAWKIWSDMTTFVNWIEIDDIVGRVSICFNLCMLYAFTTNIANGFDETYTAGLGFYLASRFLTIGWWCLVGFLTPMIRTSMFCQAGVALLGAAVWIISIHADSVRDALIFLALAIDLFGSAIIMPAFKALSHLYPSNHFLSCVTDYIPAVNIEHRTERMSAFMSLVFGYSVITILYQSAASDPLDTFLGKGILALVQAYVFNWLYFEIDIFHIHTHAIRRAWYTAFVWMAMHLPFAASYILAASSLKSLVLAHDGRNADPAALADDYRVDSYAAVPGAIRWFYCGGLGCALLSMTLISLSHTPRPTPQRIPRPARLAGRCAAAVAIVCLPLSHLDSLGLVATTTSLVVLCLAADLAGCMPPGESFVHECWGREGRGEYEAKVAMGRERRCDLRDRLVRGERVGLGDVVDEKSGGGEGKGGGGEGMYV